MHRGVGGTAVAVSARVTDGSALADAAFRGDLERLNALLADGADPDAPTADGRTPLMHAILGDQLAVAAALLAHGADLEARAGDGATALLKAVLWRRTKAVELLLAHGADRRVRDVDGWTPRDMAEAQNDTDTLALLDAVP